MPFEPTSDRVSQQIGDARLVTLAMPTYNSARYVAETLDQLLAQDLPNIEIVICDDCSADNTVEICRRYAEQHPDKIRLAVNEQNLGGWRNFLRCLELGSGKYAVWCCPGDHWTPDFVSKQVARLEAVAGAVACACGIALVREDSGEPVKTITYGGPKAPENLGRVRAAISTLVKVRSHETDRASLGAVISSLLARDKALKALESFDGCGAIMNERQVICQLALSGAIVHVDDVLITKIIHSAPPSQRLKGDPSRIANKKRFFYARAAGKLICSLSRSRIVPWRRKLFIPIIVGSYLARDFADITFIWSVAVLRAVLPERLYHALRRAYRKRRPA